MMVVEVAKRLFTVDEYYQMAEAGILMEDDRVELLEGEVVEMTPIGRRHAACVNRLNRLFSRQVGEHAIVSIQNPVHLSEYSEPQPDLALLQPRPDFYAQAHPGTEDVLLVVEVAETSADSDRNVKVPLYARAGIPEVWLVDLAEECVEIYRKPSPRGYGEVRRAWRGERLFPQAFPEMELAVDDVLA
jgi:Uma2 family endonuclease